MLWLGHDPAVVLHHTLGTSWANWVMAGVYLVWIGLVPASLAIALVWTRRSPAGAWYVTAISLDWCLGAALYFAVPSLGPVYSSPEWFASLPHTPNTSVSEMLLADRIEVLAGPWDTGTVQTIAAFASLHVAVMFTICLMAEQMRLPVAIRVRSVGVPRAHLRGDGLPGVALLRGRARRLPRRRRGLRAGGQGHRQPAAPSR